jgi:acid phosphatase family membrane protein YuiD
MPSGHSATVSALCVSVGYVMGVGSAAFALSVILAIIVMHDATGVRRETGKQAVTIMDIINAINDMAKEKDPFVHTEKLKVLVGHSPVQVVFGALLGIGMAYFCQRFLFVIMF